jgi:hypothetical protein
MPLILALKSGAFWHILVKRTAMETLHLWPLPWSEAPQGEDKRAVIFNLLTHQAKLRAADEIYAISTASTTQNTSIYGLAILFYEDYTLSYESKRCSRRQLADGKSYNRRGGPSPHPA